MRRTLLEIGYEYARKHQSPQTGFLHFGDTIPLYDNLLFALLLMQTKTVENTLEGMKIVEKLMHFQTPSGFFPRHVHEYPTPAQINHQVEILDLLRRIAPRFDISKFENAIQGSKEELHPSKRHLFDPSEEWRPDSIRSWGEYLKAKDPTHLPKWNGTLMVCLEEAEQLEWEQSETLPTFIDLYMSSLLEKIPHRLKKGSRAHLEAALLPYEFPAYEERGEDYSFVGSTLFVGKADDLYPLVIETDGTLERQDDLYLITLKEEEHPGDQDRIECRIYFPARESTLFVNGTKQNTFTFQSESSGVENTVTIQYPHGTVSIRCTLEEGVGDFMGHLSRFDRPGQNKEGGKFISYDHCIAIRSLRRSKRGAISCQVSVGLSEASPIA